MMGSRIEIQKKYNGSRQTKGSNSAGFTLLELCIALIIVGVLIAPLFALYTRYYEEKKVAELESSISEVRMALLNYIVDDPLDASDPPDSRYPCPASPSATIGSANYGVEDCSLQTAAIGTCSNDICVHAGSDGTPVLVGSLPTRTLEIPSDLMLDPYKQRFTFAVSAALTQPNAMLNTTVSGNITIRDEAAPITDSAQFALISHGKNGEGAYTAAGVRNALNCSGTTAEAENCNDDAVFLLASASHGDNASFYDDSLVFKLSPNRDEWWQETNATGTNIVNRNTQNVGIGFSVGEPAEKLDVGGNIRARQNVVADTDVTAGQNITATGNVSAGLTVSGQNVTATLNVTAGQNITATGEVAAGTNVRAGQNVHAGQNVYGRHFYYSDVPSGGDGGTPTDGGSGGGSFGGIYTFNLDGSCRYGNPMTGGCSCPGGFRPAQFLEYSNPTCAGGTYQDVDPDTGEIPRTENCGFESFQCWK